MGTRHHIVVTDKDGVIKVRQYAQWDGYFEGAGLEMLGVISQPGFLDELEDKLSVVEALPADDPKLPQLSHWGNPGLLPLQTREWFNSFGSRDLSYRVLENIVNSGRDEILLKKDDGFLEKFSYHLNYRNRTWVATRHLANKDHALAYPLDELPSADRFMLDALKEEKDRIYVFDLEKRQIISRRGDETFTRSF
jgi:hypothetical protein